MHKSVYLRAKWISNDVICLPTEYVSFGLGSSIKYDIDEMLKGTGKCHIYLNNIGDKKYDLGFIDLDEITLGGNPLDRYSVYRETIEEFFSLRPNIKIDIVSNSSNIMRDLELKAKEINIINMIDEKLRYLSENYKEKEKEISL